MKRKLITAYLLVLISFMIPTTLSRPEHIGTLTARNQEILQAIQPYDLLEFHTAERIPISAQDYVKIEAAKYGWDSGYEWESLHRLLTNESGWNPYIYNASSGACGLFQALPCSKLGAPVENVSNQAKWGLNYIKTRYGSPSKALNFWLYEAPNHNGSHWY